MDSFYRDTWAEINLNHIADNIRAVMGLLKKPKKMIAVVKANAYGHGDEQVARIALEEGASMLAVAFLDEAIALRKKGIVDPILVLGAVPPRYVDIAARYQIQLIAYSIQWLEEVVQIKTEGCSLDIHLKVDTGMGRLGIRSINELTKALRLLQTDSPLRFEGICTHFATADELDTKYYETQYERFKEIISFLKTEFTLPPYIHCANSAALLRFPNEIFNSFRLGIVMYGLSPSPEIKHILPVQLKEAFSLHSKLVHVKKVEKGTHISYGATYTAEADEWIGTIPIGYADGWIRKMQHFNVLVGGCRVPVVGRVCMDQFMVKLPQEYRVGEKVTLVGQQQNQKISIDDVAKHLETINYEVPCIISQRVPRVFIRDNKIVQVANYLLGISTI